jgi:hypothetical protein
VDRVTEYDIRIAFISMAVCLLDDIRVLAPAAVLGGESV